MVDESLEFAISQYLDGTLPPEEVAALEKRLAEDAQARALFEEHRKLDAALKAPPLPAVNWDRLQAHISAAIDEQEQSQRMRITTWFAAAGRAVRSRGAVVAALAACIAIAITVARVTEQDPAKPAGPSIVKVTPGGDAPPAGDGVLQISVMGPEKPDPAAKGTVEVAILSPDQAPDTTSRFLAEAYAYEDLIDRPTYISLLIASDDVSRHDVFGPH